MGKPVILTGLRTNNDLHLGNYLGALLPMVKLQRQYASEYQINMFAPDLHSFTTPVDHTRLYAQTIKGIKMYVAAGLNLQDQNTYLYRQSFIPAHSELTVILNNFTYMGELSRMTQYKEKGAQQQNVSAGLFDYPVLMAADILLYGAIYVPVGDDQSQHVELARDIAQRMNNKFNQGLFILPADEKKQIAFTNQHERLRIRDLMDPTKKMSKSDASGKGVIFLNEDPETAAKKIMSATTDNVGNISHDMTNQPGISNLLQLLASLTHVSLSEVTKKYEGQSSYADLKADLSQVVKSFLTDFQEKFASIDEQALQAKLASSEAAMNEMATKTLQTVQRAVGLRQ